MKENVIKSIIDEYLKKTIYLKLNSYPGEIEKEMLCPENEKEEEWQTWIPIDSKVTDHEIIEFEKQINYRLPEYYKIFLKHKHFYDLYIAELSFCRHPIKNWQEGMLELIFNGWPKEYLIEKGYIPFADYSDWGMLCFDANRNKVDCNYPIVLWDHEIAVSVEDKFEDFYDMLVKLDQADKASYLIIN